MRLNLWYNKRYPRYRMNMNNFREFRCNILDFIFVLKALMCDRLSKFYFHLLLFTHLNFMNKWRKQKNFHIFTINVDRKLRNKKVRLYWIWSTHIIALHVVKMQLELKGISHKIRLCNALIPFYVHFS